jgi:hypothetical protein
MFGDDCRPHHSLRAIDWRLMRRGKEPAPDTTKSGGGIDLNMAICRDKVESGLHE